MLLSQFRKWFIASLIDVRESAKLEFVSLFTHSGLKLWQEQLLGFYCNTKRFLFLPLNSHSKQKDPIVRVRKYFTKHCNQYHILKGNTEDAKELLKLCQDFRWVSFNFRFKSQKELFKACLIRCLLENLNFTVTIIDATFTWIFDTVSASWNLSSDFDPDISALVLWYSYRMTVGAKLRK